MDTGGWSDGIFFRRNWCGIGLNGLDMWKEWEMKNGQREQVPRKWREKEARKSENGLGGKRGLERVGGEWRTTVEHRWSWSLVIRLESAVREVRRGKKGQRKDDSNYGRPHP